MSKKQSNNTFNEAYYINAIKKFQNTSNNVNETRYKSWEYCYTCFKNLYEKYKNSTEDVDDYNKDIDHASIMLAYYMASWGMYRGSSFLLQNDYKIYVQIVKSIVSNKYQVLWKYAEQLTSLKNNKKDKEDYIQNIIELANEIDNCFKEQKYYFINKNIFKKKLITKDNIKISDTIITKIMLGTICCMPALDTFFKKSYGLSDTSNFFFDNQNKPEKLKNNISLLIDSIIHIETCLNLNQQINIEENLKDTLTSLPPIKRFDMYHFIKGLEAEFVNLYNIFETPNDLEVIIKKIEKNSNYKQQLKGSIKYCVLSDDVNQNKTTNIISINCAGIDSSNTNLDKFKAFLYKQIIPKYKKE